MTEKLSAKDLADLAMKVRHLREMLPLLVANGTALQQAFTVIDHWGEIKVGLDAAFAAPKDYRQTFSRAVLDREAQRLKIDRDLLGAVSHQLLQEAGQEDASEPERGQAADTTSLVIRRMAADTQGVIIRSQVMGRFTCSTQEAERLLVQAGAYRLHGQTYKLENR